MKELKVVSDAREEILDKFKNIEFVESTHQYFITNENGIKIEYTPVSNIISQWAVPFDTEAQAEKYAIKHGLEKNDVLNDWKYKNLLATTNGTIVHAFAESYSWLKNGHPENINDECKFMFDKSTKWLIPINGKMAAAKKFWDELDPNMYLVGAEFKMCSQYLNTVTKMAGTFDLLLYYDNKIDKKKSGFVLCDYKTNKDLYSEYNETHEKYMLYPFNNMIDENVSHYCLQFACYSNMLESIGINIIGRRLIWLKDNGDYEIIKIEDKSKELLKVL